MKIYLVTSGSYSDFGNIAAFSNKKKAEEFMHEYPDDGYNDLEIYELDEPGNYYKKGKRFFTVGIERDGEIGSLYYDAHATEKSIHFNMWGKKLRMWYTLEARNRDEAIKIANDKRSQMIALNEWDKIREETIEKEKREYQAWQEKWDKERGDLKG